MFHWFGVGSWSIVDPIGGSISLPTSPTSNFTGVLGNYYILRWTISNPPCADSFDDVTITLNENPTIANAGADQILNCDSTSTILAGNVPLTGVGISTILSGVGGSLSNPNSATSSFTGTPLSTSTVVYQLEWRTINEIVKVQTLL